MHAGLTFAGSDSCQDRRGATAQARYLDAAGTLRSRGEPASHCCWAW